MYLYVVLNRNCSKRDQYLSVGPIYVIRYMISLNVKECFNYGFLWVSAVKFSSVHKFIGLPAFWTKSSVPFISQMVNFEHDCFRHLDMEGKKKKNHHQKSSMCLFILQKFRSVLCTCRHNWQKMDSKGCSFSIKSYQFLVTYGEIFLKGYELLY